MNLTHFSVDPFTLDTARTYTQRADLKPHGLWLSDEDDHGWKTWCTDERFNLDALEYETRYRLTADANVLHLDTVEAIDSFTTTYANNRAAIALIEWPTVAAQYDGILITPYQWARRLDQRTIWYYGFDVASACIWNLSVLEATDER